MQIKKLEPVPHPGEILIEELKRMDLGIKEFSIRINRAEKTIFDIIKLNSSITSDMAIAFEHVTKKPAQFWLKHQRLYDEYLARKRQEVDVLKSKDWLMKFPIDEMAERGWIEKSDNLTDQLSSICDFFCISSMQAWENLYIKQRLRIFYNFTLSEESNPQAISAWLRYGEIESDLISIKTTYTAKSLRDALTRMENIIFSSKGDFSSLLKKECQKVGIKLICVPCFSCAPIICAARWYEGVPVIQMSSFDMDNSDFFLAFLHGAGHILIHGKKEVFLEGVEHQDHHRGKDADIEKFTSRFFLLKDEDRKSGTKDYAIGSTSTKQKILSQETK